MSERKPNRERLLGAALVTLATLALAGCGVAGPKLEEIRELAEARDLCNAEGGVFEQYTNGWGTERWTCDFDQTGDQ